MKIFYGSSKGKADVSGDSPTEASLEMSLEVFRNLDARSGFMGINLGEKFVVQFAPDDGGRIRVELLDTSRPAFDAASTDKNFAESLIGAAAAGKDVFQVARSSSYEWEHTEL